MDGRSIIDSAHRDRAFEIDGERFVLSDLFPGGGDQAFSIIKPPSSIQQYLSLLQDFEHPVIVEIGVAYGGSTAFLALAAEPVQLVALEISPDRLPRLDEMIERRGLTSQVHVHYGVDQQDIRRVSSTIDEHITVDGRIDVVIDDASHQYEPTLATFNALFPRLATGGVYVIEDWACDHRIGQLIVEASADTERGEHDWAKKMLAGDFGSVESGHRPLASVAAERLGAPAWRDGHEPELLSRIGEHLFQRVAEGDPSIESVHMTGEWIVVKRADGPIDRTTYDLSQPYFTRSLWKAASAETEQRRLA